jgi:hypothetical protein
MQCQKNLKTKLENRGLENLIQPTSMDIMHITYDIFMDSQAPLEVILRNGIILLVRSVEKPKSGCTFTILIVTHITIHPIILLLGVYYVT